MCDGLSCDGLSCNVPVSTSLDKSYAKGIDVVVVAAVTINDNRFVAPADIKYNAEKEEKAKQERKQRQLEAVELARQIEEEKKNQNGIP